MGVVGGLVTNTHTQKMSGPLQAVAVKLENESGLVTLPHTTDGPRHLIYIGPFEFREAAPEVEEVDPPQRSATSGITSPPPPSRMSTMGG